MLCYTYVMFIYLSLLLLGKWVQLSSSISWSSTGTLPNSFCTTAIRCP